MTDERNMDALRQLEESLKPTLPPLPSPPAKPKQNGNGNGDSYVAVPVELPPDRAKAVEYGLAQFQQLGHERDELRKENNDLRDKLAAVQIQNEGLTSQLTEAMSHVRSMMMVRDQSVAERVKYESLFVSIQAQMRAFAVPAAPFVVNADDGEQH